MSNVALTLLQRYAKLREQYLQEHPQKRLFPTIEKYARVITPREQIIRPGPALEPIIQKSRNLGIIILVGLVALAVLKD